MAESEAKTRKNRIDEKLKSSLLNWTIIHNDKASDYSALTSQIKNRDFNLDISWLKDENLEGPNSLPEPQLLVADAITELSACVDELQLILDEIEAEEME